MRWIMIRIILFLSAFAAFAAMKQDVGWTMPVKVFAAALTLGGLSFLI